MKFNVQLRLVLLAVLLLALSVPRAGAQMKIGLPAGAANAAAILDVSNSGGGNKGLLFPLVPLASTTTWSLAGTATNGMAVFNTTPSGSGSTAVFTGLYIWNNGQWNQMSSQSGTSAATFTGGTLTCTGTLSGTYQAGIAMTGSNTKVVTSTLATGGTYSATTTTVNGVLFTVSGTALSTGASNFTLTASGTPVSGGTFAYPISFGGQNCTFNVTFSGVAIFACGTATTVQSPTGALVNGTLYTGSYTIAYMAGNGTAYGIATQTVNGLTLSRVAGTYAAGGGNVVYNLTGTASTAATAVFTIPECTSVTFGFLSPTSGGTGVVSAWDCTGTDVGSLQVGVAASGVTHAITATVTTVGTYNVTATTSGVTYTGTGTFAGTGSQTITLTASGTPTTQGSNSFTTSANTACSFTETVAPAATFACGSATTIQSPTGVLVNTTAYTGSYTIAYTAGNGTSYGTTTQTVNGLTLTRTAGTFASGGGNVVYNLIGTAGAAAMANFTIAECTMATFGCSNDISVGSGAIVGMLYDNTGSGTVNYAWCARTVVGPDGLTWLDRNLGAYQVATSTTDAQSYGSFYQWGRNTDGHQRIAGRGVDNATSTTTYTLATSNIPGNDLFIINGSGNEDWRSGTDNTRWNNITGTSPNTVQENNPCPSGYRVPTNAEQVTLANGWTTGANAYNSSLRLPMPGFRVPSDGSLNGIGSYAYYWSATPYGTTAYNLQFTSSGIFPGYSYYRASGFSVRCLRN